MKLLVLFVLNSLLSLYGTVSGNIDVTAHQDFPLHLKEREDKDLTFTLRNDNGNVYRIMAVVQDGDIAGISSNLSQTIGPGTSSRMNFTAKLRGIFLGRTTVKLYTNSNSVSGPDPAMYDVISEDLDNTGPSDWYQIPGEYNVTVSRKESAISHSFTGTIIILVCLANIAMGCKTELSVVKEVLKKPIGPLTGMFSQFLLMPLVSLNCYYCRN